MIFGNNKKITRRSIRHIPKKNLTWGQAKVRYPRLNPYKDADGDKIMNMLDCKPFNKRRQGGENDDRLGGKRERKMTEKQVIKMYIDQTKEWKPKATKKDIEGQIQLAKMSYAENEGNN